jgi:hypothetical protein
MDESVAEWSEWWVGGAPETRAHGELRFDAATGASLTLYGLLPDLHAVRFRSPPLLGETFDGTQLTLVSPALLQRNDRFGGGVERTRMRLRGSTLLSGCHAEDPAQLVVDRAIVRLTGLRELCLRPWPTETGSFFVESGLGVVRRIVVAAGSLTFRRSTETRRPDQFTESSELDVDVLIEIDEPLPLKDFEDRWLRPLHALILFAARAPVALKGFTLLLNDPDAADGVHPAIRRGTSPQVWTETHVDVLTETPSLSGKPPTSYDRPLVPFNALGDSAEGFIGRWWSLYTELGTAAVLLFSALGSELFLDQKLLTLMSFLESYHRQKHDKPKVPAEIHKHNVSAMLGVIEDKAQHDHYKQKLRYAGEQNARQRVKSLVKRAHQTLPPVPRLDAKLADHLVDTRNALTHLDPSGKPGLHGVDLVYATARLQLVIQTNLLLDLQLGKDKVGELVLTSYQNQMPVRDFATEDSD